MPVITTGPPTSHWPKQKECTAARMAALMNSLETQSSTGPVISASFASVFVPLCNAFLSGMSQPTKDTGT